MSPTENDLRAALRHGEGDGLDPSAIAAAGRLAAARRRSRIVNTAAAIVLIGAIGTGGTFLLRGSGDDARQNASGAAGGAKAPNVQALDRTNGANGGSAAGISAAARPGSGSSRGSANVPGVAVPQAGVGCPKTPAATTPPVDGGGSGPLFTSTPDQLTVCTYAGPAATPTRTVLTDVDARTVAASLEAAPTTRPTGMCPDYRLAGERTVEIIGTAAGAPVGTVTTTLDRPACATVVTNGKAIRFGWRPPTPLLRRTGPIGGRSHGPIAQSSLPSK